MRNIFAYFCALFLFIIFGPPQIALAEVYLTPKDVVLFSKMRHHLVSRNFVEEDKERLELLSNERSKLMRKIEYLRRTGHADQKQKDQYHVHLSLYPDDVQKQLREISSEILEIDNQIVEMKKLNALRLINDASKSKVKEEKKEQLQYLDKEKQVKLPYYVIPNSFFAQHQRRQQRIYKGYRANITNLPQVPVINEDQFY